MTHIDGLPIGGPNDLNVAVSGQRAGDAVVVRVTRRREPVDVAVVLGDPAPWPDPAVVEATYRRVLD